MLARDISAALARSAEDVARYLLPQGKREGSEWRCGSLGGEPGGSLGVHLTGAKAGVWKDFAEGSGGDLLDLWREARGLTMVEAMDEALAYLGVESHRPQRVQAKTFVKPTQDRSWRRASGAALEYLRSRGLDEKTVRAYRVASTDTELVFPFFVGDQLTFWKALGLTRIGGKKRIHAAKDAQPVLFGWQAIPESARQVVITEGEIDALSVAQMGFPALSMPSGTNNLAWIEHDFERLERFDDIYLCFDMDEPGRKAVQEVAERLGRHRVRVVELPTNDANDLLCEGGTLDLGAAKELLPDLMERGDAYLDAVLAKLHPEDYPGAIEEQYETPWRKADDKLMFRAGEVVLVAGYNGSGKSQLVQHLALQQMYHGHTVCYASLEMAGPSLMYRTTRQATGLRQPTAEYARAVHAWFGAHLLIYSAGQSSKLDPLLGAFEYARQRYGCKVFVVDNLAKCGMAEDDYNGQKAYVDALTDFAKATGSVVIVVHHLRKGVSESDLPGKMDLKGSGAITDMADTVCLLWRNKPKEEAEEQGLDVSERGPLERTEDPDACLRVVKQRNGEWEGKLWLWFDVDSYQYLGAAEQRPFRYVGCMREVAHGIN